jgi:serine/threonine protein kinase/tetratricopeptide (TPR) repeat protein
MRRVAHLTSDEWDAFAAGHLEGERAAAVTRHLHECDDCRGKAGRTAVTHHDRVAAAATDELGRGTTIGRYLVLERLGAGGMGVVYAAYDPQLDRRIALKLLRRDLGNSQRTSRVRMLREAQAMARLAHPNVIAVHDVGEVDERVFVAMELVDGSTLKAWLCQRLASGRPAMRAILDVFSQAGRGLAAAHAAGLVHRDFKPENVLVGADGRARVTDFGLARSANARDDSASPSPLPPDAVTTSRARRLPEEELGTDLDGDTHSDGRDGSAPTVLSVSGSLDAPLTRAGTMMGTPGYMPPEQCQGGAIDARADQFSFCASLFEALYGFRAFAGQTSDEVIDNVLAGRVREAPADSDVPTWVRRVLLRGLAVAPAARWPSMNALLDQLGRDPVRRRRRWFAAAGVTVSVASLMVGAQQWGARGGKMCLGSARHLAGVWDDAHRLSLRAAFAESGKVYAAQAARAAESALDGYAAAWVAMHGDACESTRVRGDQTEATMALRMACLDERKKELAALTQLFADADAETVERALPAVEALPPVSLCADVQALAQVAPPPADPTLRARIAAARTQLATARARLGAGKYAAGLALAEEVPAAAALLGYRPLAAEALELVGELRFKAGDYHGADRAWRDAIYAAEEARLDEVKSTAAVRLANVTVDVHGFAEAHEWLRYAEAAVKRAGAGGETQVDLSIATALVWYRQSRFAEAEAAARQAVTLAAEVLPERHLGRAAAYRTLGDVLNYAGRHDEGLQLLEKARAILEAELGPDHPDVGTILRKEIDAYSLQHDGARGLELGRRVLALLSKSLPPEHLQIAQTHTSIAESLGLLGRYDEALAEEKLALPTYERLFGAVSENVGVSYTNMGWALMQLGRNDEARRDLVHAIAIYEQTLPADSPDLAEPILRLGQLELKQQRHAEAVRQLERALALRQHDRDATEMLAEVEETLGRALLATGEHARAIALLARARDQWRDGGRTKEAATVSALLAETKR